MWFWLWIKFVLPCILEVPPNDWIWESWFFIYDFVRLDGVWHSGCCWIALVEAPKQGGMDGDTLTRYFTSTLIPMHSGNCTKFLWVKMILHWYPIL
jgi:hypothetical protein